MKRIIQTSALALMLGTSGMVLEAAAQMTTYEAQPGQDMYASELIGSRIYSAEKDFDSFDENTMVADDSEKEWDDIGEVNDVILGRDGRVKAVILGIGGFIGIGEKDVAIPMDQIKTVREKDDDDTFLVVKTNKEALEAATEYTRGEAEQLVAVENPDNAGTDAEKAVATTAAAGSALTEEAAEAVEEVQTETAEAVAEVKEETAEATAEVKAEAAEATEELKTTTETVAVTEAPAEEVKTETAEAVGEVKEEMAEAKTEVAETVVVTPVERPMLKRVDVQREGFMEAKREELTADKLTGMRVYGSNDEDVGEIGELILSADGSSIDRVVLDVGGFLGIGEREIAVTLDELNIVRTEDGGEFRAYIDATQEQLEAQPEYKD